MIKYIAKVLGASPKLKRNLKFFYYYIGGTFGKLFFAKVTNAWNVAEHFGINDETFYGYYGSSPVKNNFIIFHIIKDCDEVDIVLGDLQLKTIKYIDSVRSYNLQQGAKLNWISETQFIYNKDNNGDVNAILCTIDSFGEISKKYYIKPYNEFIPGGYLSISYSNLKYNGSEYGYSVCERKEPLFIDFVCTDILRNEDATRIISESDVISYRTSSEKNHVFNHLIPSPKGDKFVFIERYKVNGKRYDRLFLVSNIHDNKKIDLLLQSTMVSHLTWKDNDTLFGYLADNNGVSGYYFVSIDGHLKLLSTDFSDGHPVFLNQNEIITDTYPNFFRNQKLYKVNVSNLRRDIIYSQYIPIDYQESNRCDFHPKLNRSEGYVYFDNITDKGRQLCRVRI